MISVSYRKLIAEVSEELSKIANISIDTEIDK